MNKFFFIFNFTLFTLVFSARLNKLQNRDSYPPNPNWDPSKDHYPTIRQENISFKYPSSIHPEGVYVSDPFNWMETPLTNSSELQTFVKEEVDLTNNYLDQCSSSTKQKIKDEINKTLDLPYYTSLQQFGTIEKPIFLYSYLDVNVKASQWFLTTQEEIDQAKKEKFTNPPGKLILDCATLSEDGTAYADNWDITKDQSLAAFSLIGLPNGSEIHFIDLKNKETKHEILYNAGVQSFNFLPDGKSIIFDTEDQYYGGNSKIALHVLGTQQKEDVILVQPFEANAEANIWTITLSNDDKWVAITGSNSTFASLLYLLSLDQPLNDASKVKWISIMPQDEGFIQYFHNIGNTFFFLTTIGNSPFNKIVTATINPRKAKTTSNLLDLKDRADIQDFIPERKNAYLDHWLVLGNSTIVIRYTEVQGTTFYIYDMTTGKQTKQIFQDLMLGNVDHSTWLTGANDAYMDMSSFNWGTRCYKVSLQQDGTVTAEIELEGTPRQFDLSQYTVEQRVVTSKDGAQIPLIMMYSNKHKPDGTNPGWINFYAAFGAAFYQTYDPSDLAFINNFGGIFAYVYARGGGEFGDSWHQAAVGSDRQKTFDDLEAVSNYLVDNKIVGRGKIILNGNGPAGQEAMVVANQISEGLLGAIVSRDGLFDPLRSDNYSEPATSFSSDWGDPSTPEGFDDIFAYAPLNHVEANKVYPAILLSASSFVGDQNVKSQVFKMIATLQSTHPNNKNPLLLDFSTSPDSSLSQTQTSNGILAQTQHCFVSLSLNLKFVKE